MNRFIFWPAFLCLSGILVFACSKEPQESLEGVFIAGPPQYLGADVFFNDDHFGKLLHIEKPDAFVNRELSYRYPEHNSEDWVGLDLRGQQSKLPPGKYVLSIRLDGYYPNEFEFDFPSHSGRRPNHLFLEPLTPVTEQQTTDSE